MKYLISKVEQFLLDVCCNNYILFFIQIFMIFLCTSTLLIPNAKSRKVLSKPRCYQMPKLDVKERQIYAIFGDCGKLIAASCQHIDT